MAVKKRAEEHENHERWLVSYADFITLLFAFFVVMYASSSRDLDKVKQISVSLVKSFGSHDSGPMEKSNGQPFVDRNATRAAPVNNMFSLGPGMGGEPEITLEDMFKESDPLFQLKGRVDGILRANGALGAFQTRIEFRGLRITLTEDRIFTSSGEIKPDPMKVLQEIGKELRGMERMVVVEGIAVPTSKQTLPASQLIAMRYAAEVQRYLSKEARVPDDRLRSMVGSQSSAGFTRVEDLDDGVAIDIVVTREIVED